VLLKHIAFTNKDNTDGFRLQKVIWAAMDFS
jgi:hypothetical protein